MTINIFKNKSKVKETYKQQVMSRLTLKNKNKIIKKTNVKQKNLLYNFYVYKTITCIAKFILQK